MTADAVYQRPSYRPTVLQQESGAPTGLQGRAQYPVERPGMLVGTRVPWTGSALGESRRCGAMELTTQDNGD